MKQILLIIAVVALVGCGKKEPVQPSASNTEATKPKPPEVVPNSPEAKAEVNATKLNAPMEATLPKGGLSEEDALLAFVAMVRGIDAKKILKRKNIDENCVFSVGILDAAISKVFTEAKFEVFQGGDIDLDLGAFQKDFAKNGQASARSLKQARTQCGEAEIQFLMVATLDIFLPSFDEATGKSAVTCVVNAKVYQLKKRGKFVTGIVKASMFGNPFVGLGPNDDVAKQNAINAAAENTAEKLRDQLRAKGLTP